MNDEADLIRAEGAAAEKDRLRAILALPAAEHRQAAAITIALDTDLSVDQAAGLLGTLAETKPQPAPKPKPGDHFAQMVASLGGTAAPEAPADERPGADVLALVERVGIPGFRHHG